MTIDHKQNLNVWSEVKYGYLRGSNGYKNGCWSTGGDDTYDATFTCDLCGADVRVHNFHSTSEASRYVQYHCNRSVNHMDWVDE